MLLIQAVQEGNLAKVQELIGQGANINEQDYKGYTPLVVACRLRHAPIALYLLSIPGIDVNAGTYTSGSPLFLLSGATDDANTEVFNKLVTFPEVNANEGDPISGETPLFRAVSFSFGNVEKVNRLLFVPEIDVNKENTLDRYTPLHFACKIGYLDIVNRLLLEDHIDVNKPSGLEMETSLLGACLGGHVDIVNRLLSVPGIDVNLQDEYLRSPLLVACNEGYLDIVKALVEHPTLDANHLQTVKEIARTGRFPPEITLFLLGPHIESKVYWLTGNDENSLYAPIEEGNTLAILNPKHQDQRIVIQKADGTYTDGWEYLRTQKKNPVTREPVNINRLNKRTVIAGPQVPTGGKRRKTVRRKLKKRKTQKRRN